MTQKMWFNNLVNMLGCLWAASFSSTDLVQTPLNISWVTVCLFTSVFFLSSYFCESPQHKTSKERKIFLKNHIRNTAAPILTHTMSHLELLRCLPDVSAAKIEFSEKSGSQFMWQKDQSLQGTEMLLQPQYLIIISVVVWFAPNSIQMNIN